MTKYNVGLGGFLAILIIAVALIVAIPLVTIWSFNTLFGFAIEYNLATWFATFWLHAALTGAVGSAIRRNKD
jgi:hypothetical protein